MKVLYIIPESVDISQELSRQIWLYFIFFVSRKIQEALRILLSVRNSYSLPIACILRAQSVSNTSVFRGIVLLIDSLKFLRITAHLSL